MKRPATRLREGLERIKASWQKLLIAEQEHGQMDVPDDVVEQLEAAEADLTLGEEGSAERLLEALDDEYQRGREDAFREAAVAARQAAENTTRSDVAVGGIVQKVVEGFIAWCEVRARESSR